MKAKTTYRVGLWIALLLACSPVTGEQLLVESTISSDYLSAAQKHHSPGSFGGFQFAQNQNYCAGACRNNYAICNSRARNPQQVNACEQQMNACMYGC